MGEPMTDITPEAVAKMLDEADGMLAAFRNHPDVSDQTIRILGSSETMTLHEMLSDLFRFIAWAREAVPALAAERDKWKKLTEASDDTRKVLEREWERSDAAWRARAEAAEAKLAEREVQVTRLLEDQLNQGIALEAAEARAAELTAENEGAHMIIAEERSEVIALRKQISLRDDRIRELEARDGIILIRNVGDKP